MYVAPNSTIKIMTVPLEPTYDHTLYFASRTLQYTYFAGVTGVTFSEQYYTRPYRGAIRVEINADNAYAYNYMMFQNTAYGNKWFYAFITECRWINNQVTEFRFMIDVMQTWMFDYELGNCFVEREHSFTDNIGDNLVPENLEIGDYKFLDWGNVPMFNNYKIVMISTVDANMQDATPVQLGGVYTGLNYLLFNNASTASAYISDLTDAGKADAIQAIYMIPYVFTETDSNGDPVVVTHNIPKDNFWSYTFDNKTGPRNKKLFTAPFNQLLCVNQQGNSNVMPYEYFSTSNCQFELMGIASPVPEAQILPKNYKGLINNYNERMTISNFPMCAYATDAYKAWLAQNKTTIKLEALDIGWDYIHSSISGSNVSGALHGLTNVAGGMATGNLGSLVDGGIQFTNSVSDSISQGVNASYDAGQRAGHLLAEMRRHAILPPNAHGGSTNALGIASKTLGFRFYTLRIRDEFAAIVDDYFDRFGYACHRNVRPNTHSRPHWNYVKTVGCTLHGSIPGDVAVQISSIYDHGITFWKNASEVGNYDLDNRPT